MWWQKALKAILPENLLNADVKVLDSLEDIKIASDNTSNKQTIINNGTLIILNGGENDEAAKLLNNIDVEELNKGDTLLETKSAETLDEINNTFWSPPVQNALSKYGPMVNSSDYAILESAIYIQSLYDRGVRVSEFMRDISVRYGARGTMICHLYSAGYFESLIAPLYSELMQNDSPRVEEYEQIYELIVTESPLALFVSQRDSVAGIEGKVAKKISVNKDLGVNYLNIHGIGRENINNIKRALTGEKLKAVLVGELEEKTENSMSTITIYF